jgi:hypothetical protein
MRQWRAKNPDKVKQYRAKRRYDRDYQQKYRVEHKDYYRKYNAQWKKKNPDKVKKYASIQKENRIDRYLKLTYGISSEQYHNLLAQQSDKCAICLRHKTEFKRALHVDHDHSDKSKVRGLLCVNCNKMLGHSHDNPEILFRGIAYLQKSKIESS